MIQGDNELAAVDFQRHYRMPIVHLMDPDRSFDRKYNRNGWPFLMLVDSNGEVIYKCTNLVDREKELMRLLNKIKNESYHAETMEADGIYYMAATLQRSGYDKQPPQNDRFTSIATGQDGKIYTVFTSVKNNNSDIFMRILDGDSSVRDLPVATTDADEYDGTVLVDNENNIWICWTSNAVDDIYQIHLTNLKDIEAGNKNIIVSQTKEDSMHGRIISDDSGTLWITYYQWHKMGQNSRDKEVYLRKLSNGTLSESIHISPTDIPDYEDHTDPAISILANQVYVSWSWDFHQPKGYTTEAKEPTIFARTIEQDMTLGKSFHLSGHGIDSTPVFSTEQNKLLWCAWDCLARSRNSRRLSKTLYARSLNGPEKQSEQIAIAGNLVNICSPCFAFYNNQKGVLTWSQTQNAKDWSLCKSQYDSQQNRWTEPAAVITDGNPRFGSCVYDTKGRLWIACSIQTEKGREIIVKGLD